MSVNLNSIPAGQFAGVNIEEPENWGALVAANQPAGVGYDLSGSANLIFDVRSPTSAEVTFGMGQNQCFTSAIYNLIPAWQTITLAVPSSCLSSVHVLFAVTAINSSQQTANEIVLLDNIRYEPVPTSHLSALGLPVGNQTFGVVPVESSPAPDQVLRNLAPIYESALTEFSLLARGQAQDLQGAALIANTFDYALSHDNHGDPLPTGSNGSTGLHNAYEDGDIALFNDQSAPKLGKAGDVRLAGFTSLACAPSEYCLVLDGATGGNNAFAILALVRAYQQFGNLQYLNDARTIGNWIISNLSDTSGTGFGGYFAGYPDMGMAKILETGKSTENNADISAAFNALASVTAGLGLTSESNSWQQAADAAGDFVMQMFDNVNGRFNVGTVPPGTASDPANGNCPSTVTKGNDVINTCDFLDTDTFTTLALAWSPRYRNQIDWHLPIDYALKTFIETVTAQGQTYSGFGLVPPPQQPANGVAWEFTGQMCEGMQFVDSVYGDLRYQNQVTQCLSWLAQAQATAPFGDQQGLVASTIQNGNMLTPYDQCVMTPYQCIAERTGLAATNWAILAQEGLNPFVPPFTMLAGTMKEISIGADGAVWRVNSSGEISTYNAQTQSWTQVPGELVQVAVGSANAVWGINIGGQIYRWDTNKQSWDYITGNLSQIAAGGDGDIWGINAAGEIYQFDGQSQSWQQIPGSLNQIAVGLDGAIWGINNANSVYRFNPGTGRFEQVPNASLVQIAVGADGDVWGLDKTGQSYHFNRLTQKFDQIPGTLSQISVGTGSNVWGLGTAGQLYEYNTQSASWTLIASAPLTQISVGADGSVWGIDSSDNAHQFIGPTQPVQMFQQIPGTLAQIAAGTDGSVWGVNSLGQIYTFNPLTQGWTYMPGELNYIAVGTGESVWGINSAEQIYHYNPAVQSWDWIQGSLTNLAVGANGDVWGINSGEQIYRYDPATSGWKWIPGSLQQISVGADGTVWGLNYLNNIYRFDTLTEGWVQAPGTLKQIAVGSVDNVWGINSDDGAYRFDWPSRSWIYVPGVFLNQIAVAFDGAVWGIDLMNQVWRFDTQNQIWVQVPGSLTQITVASDAVVWGLDSTGSIYWYR
ncbi:MAG TPA: tectonin domain-containing protein [Bryobacteraceae bacterium]|nr:tectonin domain-containing protein [Bryobacteraceae bacterium]